MFVPVKMTPKLQKPMVFQHFQIQNFKKHRFFNVFWLREASVSQSGPDRALGKLAEGLYRRKLLIKRDSESLFLSFGERSSRSIASADVTRALDAPGALTEAPSSGL